MIIKAIASPGVAVVTFDLNFANGADYKCVTEQLEKAGLLKTITDESGKTATLPENIYYGEFQDTKDVVALRERIQKIVVNALKFCRVEAEYFVFVAGVPWAWVTNKQK